MIHILNKGCGIWRIDCNPISCNVILWGNYYLQNYPVFQLVYVAERLQYTAENRNLVYLLQRHRYLMQRSGRAETDPVELKG